MNVVIYFIFIDVVFIVFRICTKIGLCCNLACLLAIIMEPFMPQTANKIATQMNIDLTRIILKDFVPMFFQPGHKMEKVWIIIF